jgi:hypothetical protein
VQDPVLGRALRGRFQSLGLAVQHVLAILRMQLAGPQLGVVAPLLGGEAEDGLDLRADIVPATGGPDIGDVEDRRDAM